MLNVNSSTTYLNIVLVLILLSSLSSPVIAGSASIHLQLTVPKSIEMKTTTASSPNQPAFCIENREQHAYRLSFHSEQVKQYRMRDRLVNNHQSIMLPANSHNCDSDTAPLLLQPVLSNTTDGEQAVVYVNVRPI